MRKRRNRVFGRQEFSSDSSVPTCLSRITFASVRKYCIWYKENHHKICAIEHLELPRKGSRSGGGKRSCIAIVAIDSMICVSLWLTFCEDTLTEGTLKKLQTDGCMPFSTQDKRTGNKMGIMPNGQTTWSYSVQSKCQKSLLYITDSIM